MDDLGELLCPVEPSPWALALRHSPEDYGERGVPWSKAGVLILHSTSGAVKSRVINAGQPSDDGYRRQRTSLRQGRPYFTILLMGSSRISSAPAALSLGMSTLTLALLATVVTS